MSNMADAVLTRTRIEEARTRLPAPGEAGRTPSRPLLAAEALIRHLAIDRLRELRDEGASFPYIARMYGVGTEELRELFAHLNYGPRIEP